MGLGTLRYSCEGARLEIWNVTSSGLRWWLELKVWNGKWEEERVKVRACETLPFKG